MAAATSKTDVTWEQVWAEQQNVDQKLDLLARAVGLSSPKVKELKDWSDRQKSVYVDPTVAEAQAALEEAQEKAKA